ASRGRAADATLPRGHCKSRSLCPGRAVPTVPYPLSNDAPRAYDRADSSQRQERSPVSCGPSRVSIATGSEMEMSVRFTYLSAFLVLSGGLAAGYGCSATNGGSTGPGGGQSNSNSSGNTTQSGGGMGGDCVFNCNSGGGAGVGGSAQGLIIVNPPSAML